MNDTSKLQITGSMRILLSFRDVHERSKPSVAPFAGNFGHKRY